MSGPRCKISVAAPETHCDEAADACSWTYQTCQQTVLNEVNVMKLLMLLLGHFKLAEYPAQPGNP